MPCRIEKSMKRETVYLQGDDAKAFERDGYCERCLRPACE